MVNWKYHCIDELKCHRYKVHSLETLPEDISRCKDQMDGIRSATSDSTPVKGGGCGREDYLINAIAKKDSLTVTLKDVKYDVEAVEKALELLTDEQRRILELFFIRREWGYKERLCNELNISLSELYRRKDEALRLYALSRYGMTER